MGLRIMTWKLAAGSRERGWAGLDEFAPSIALLQKLGGSTSHSPAQWT